MLRNCVLNADIPDFFLRLTQSPPAILGAWATSCGVSHADSARYRFCGDFAGHFGKSIFQYTLSGCGYLLFNDNLHPVPPGHAILLQPPQNSCYFAREGEVWEFCFLTLDGPEAARYWRYLIDSAGPVLSLAPDSPPLQVLGETLADRFRRSIPASWNEDALAANRFILALLTQILPRITRDDSHHSSPDWIRRVIHYIDKNPCAVLEVKGLADLVNMSRSHFTRQFIRHTGLAPARYVILRRLELAQRYLRMSRMPVTQIAARCGFAHPDTFQRAFRRHFGMTPGQYRQAATLSAIASSGAMNKA